MKIKYEHKKIEEKWLKMWSDLDLFQGSAVKSPKDKDYLLFAFAYPSGSGLHVGHVESKTALDITARYKRMNGKDVYFPVGWDAFGLPAENYAIKSGVHPAETTKQAINTFRRQIKRLGISYDWENELATSHPGYYKWTQWLFLQFYKKGLAYQGMGMVNWCPSCQTVLANEQVVDGHCERCDHEVEQRDLKQWYFKITDYKDELLSGLEEVDWPEPTKQQQRNWIGKSEGLNESWQVKDLDITLETFTTWPHTTWGATFIVVAPEHPVIKELVVGTEHEKKVFAFTEEVINEKAGGKRNLDKDKKGVFTGRYVINPLTGWEMPIYVANFAIMEYGTGIVKACPAHDERDFEFALKYDLPRVKVIDYTHETHSVVMKKSVGEDFVAKVKKNGWFVMDYLDWGYGVVVPAKDSKKYLKFIQKELMVGPWYVHTDGADRVVIFKDKIFSIEAENDQAKEYARKSEIPEEQINWDGDKNYAFCYPDQGVMVNAGDLTGMKTEDAREKIIKQAVKKGYGKETTTYKLRDWLISRQRYWGAPIPVVYDPEGKAHPVKEEHLPWKLPTDVDFKPTGESPLKSSKEFRARTEKLYGKGWIPEFDTMDTFVDSSWYYLRYCDSRNEDEFANKSKLESWLPVDLYLIGPEHIVLHLLYSRFFTKFLRDEGYLKIDEPFSKMRHQGMILGPDGKKMSKSKGNVISPDIVVDKFGADTLRIYEMFMGPLESDKPWDDGAVAGVFRFLKRIYRLVDEWQEKIKQYPDFIEKNHSGGFGNKKLARKLHQVIKKVSEDIPNLKFNTAIAVMMELVNVWEGGKHNNKPVISKQNILSFIKILAPLAPFLADELYHQVMGLKANDKKYEGIHVQAWPKYDPALAKDESVKIAVQVNGKLRGELSIVADKVGDKDDILHHAKKGVQKWLEGKELVKEIYVPGRIVSLVVKE